MRDTQAARRGRASSGSSFHYSFGLLPRDRRRGIEAVYAFCRVVDDVADEADDGKQAAAARLQRYREEIARCYDGSATLPEIRDLQKYVRIFDIPREPFEAILDGVEMDLHKTRYADFADLRGYCYRVASAVGLICLSVFGCRQPESRNYAIDLGIALQLTNILRDLKADAARGRIYIPRDEIEAFGYSEEEMLAGVRSEAFLKLMKHQADCAWRHFDTAAALLPAADRKRLLPAEVMRAIYQRLLQRIEADKFRVFEHHVSVPRLTQLSLAIRAWVTGRVGR